MIAYITGELVDVFQDSIIVEQNGIGYNIMMPLSAIDNLSNIGSYIKVYTYLHVREDIFALYGFLSRQDLEVFKLLITVSGIGPKVGLGVLSALTPDDLRFAILSEDVKTITQAPGIGVKTAKKLILELKDKFTLEEAFETKLTANPKASSSNSSNMLQVRNETVEALVVLGYSRADALRAVRSIDIDDKMTAEEAIKLSLKALV
ncbi:MAG: Holliday junction branch migration protein RuvA [Clostridiales bacterium]|jgi:Holliday junction DNA helicase RuvA|nr:Holliday junction branch migration protein RuvA [Clostridiales bacterium]